MSPRLVLTLGLLVGLLAIGCGGGESTSSPDTVEAPEDKDDGGGTSDDAPSASATADDEEEAADAETGDAGVGDAEPAEDPTGGEVGTDGERAALCAAYETALADENARYTFTDQADIDAVEASRVAHLEELAEVLGRDAPPGVQAGIQTLIDDFPIVADPGEVPPSVIEAFDSVIGYIGPICDPGDTTFDAPDGAEPAFPIVALGGVGEVGIGMPVEEAAGIIGFDTSDPVFAEESAFCAYMDPAPGSGYEGLGVMVYDGVVQRIDVFDGAYQTPSGAGIGTTEDALVGIYGDQLVFGPHPYDDQGSYVEFVAEDPANEGLALLFETSVGAVTSFRVGFAEPVGFIEGCA